MELQNVAGLESAFAIIKVAQGFDMRKRKSEMTAEQRLVYRAKRSVWEKRRRARMRAEDGRPRYASTHHIEKDLGRDDYAARQAEIPPDTRSLTAILCGDPVPSRSALAQRNLAL